MSKYGVFSDPYFSVFSPNTGKYGPEKTPSLDPFHAESERLSNYSRVYNKHVEGGVKISKEMEVRNLERKKLRETEKKSVVLDIGNMRI